MTASATSGSGWLVHRGPSAGHARPLGPTLPHSAEKGHAPSVVATVATSAAAVVAAAGKNSAAHSANRRAALAGVFLAAVLVSAFSVGSLRAGLGPAPGPTAVLSALTLQPHRLVPPRFDADREVLRSSTSCTPLANLSWEQPAVVVRLHDVYYVPVVILEVMQPALRATLLSRLDNLSAAAVGSTSPEDTSLVLFVQLTKAFGDRLSALGTAMAYAQNTQRVLVVLWEQDANFRHPFSKVFDELHNDSSSLIVVDKLPSSFRLPFNTVQDWAHFWVVYHDYAARRPTLVQQRHDLAAIRNIRRHLYIRTDRALESDYAPQTLSKELLGLLNPTRLASDAVSSATRVGRYVNVSDERAGLFLHETYSVPWDFISPMEGSMRRRLLDQFAMKESHLDSKRHPRIMAVHLQYGLGNRIRALGSAMAFASQTNRVLVVVWEPDAHLDGQFEDFFLNDFVVIRSLALGWPVKTHHDPAFRNFLMYNLMRKDNPKITSAGKFWLTNDASRHIYIKTAYVIKSKLTGTDTVRNAANSPISVHARKLLPVMGVQKLVERQLANGLSGMIGVHIRGRTIDRDISNVNVEKEYTSESSKTTNYWRKTTQLPVFIEKMRTIQNRSQSFYVAADSVDFVYDLERAFPGRIFYIPRRCDDRGAVCMHYALADVLCLSKTKYLLGSYWSSFSEAAIRLGGINVYLAGVDFGKPT